MTTTETPLTMKTYLELERATRPRRTAQKVAKYLGRWERLLLRGEYDLASIVIVHHDPRRDISGRLRKEGDGAEHLSASLRKELASGRHPHYHTLQDRLMEMDEDLDVGRLIVVQDWDEVERRGIAAVGYALSPFGDGHGSDVYAVGLYDVAREFRHIEETLRSHGYRKVGG